MARIGPTTQKGCRECRLGTHDKGGKSQLKDTSFVLYHGSKKKLLSALLSFKSNHITHQNLIFKINLLLEKHFIFLNTLSTQKGTDWEL